MSNLILYNTIMGLAASSALLLFAPFSQSIGNTPPSVRKAWGWTFGVLGGLLIVLGIHVNIAWPLLGAANIIFGEPSLIFGVLLVAAAAIIYRTPIDGEPETLVNVDDHVGQESLWRAGDLPPELRVAFRPLALVGALAGIMVILLGWAGAAFGTIVFRPPTTEWPTGLVAGTGLEIVYMVGTYTVLGIGALLLPAGLRDSDKLRWSGYLLAISGVLLLFITMISFVGHVSMSAGIGPGGIPWPPS
jgi:uncharacterized membrane protein